MLPGLSAAMMMGAGAEALPSIVGYGRAATPNGNSVRWPVPAGAVAGQLLIGFASKQNSPAVTFTPPPGYGFVEDADLGGSPAGGFGFMVAHVDLPFSLSGDLSANASGSLSNEGAGAMILFRDAAFDVIGSTATAASGNLVLPSITMTKPGILLACVQNLTNSPAAAVGMTRVYGGGSGLCVSLDMLWEEVPAGPTGTRTASIPANPTGARRGFLLGIRAK